MRLTGLEPTRRIDTSTSSWPVYQFQHSRKHVPPKKDCLIIIAIRRRNVNRKSRDFLKNFRYHSMAGTNAAFRGGSRAGLRFSHGRPGRFALPPVPQSRKVSPAGENPPEKDTRILPKRKAQAQSWESTSPMGSVITSPAARSRATGDLLIRTSRSPRK